MKRSALLVAVLAAAELATTACSFERTRSLLEPTATGSTGSGGVSLVGLWASPPSIPDINSCGNFQYEIASQTATSIAGVFTADCGGGATVLGNASGQLSGATVVLTLS